MTKIYTKRGDKGQTSTIGCTMNKSDPLAEVLGSIDELNSYIGICRGMRYEVGGKKLDEELKRIQNNLMIIASGLAGSKLKIKSYETIHLEKLIDKLTEELPELKHFIYPVGNLQVARSIARRAEREVVRIAVDQKNILKYMNRLSDALFVMGRWVNLKQGSPEEEWKK